MQTRRCAQCRKKIPASDAVITRLKSFCSMEHLIEYTKSQKAKQFASKAIRKEAKTRKEKLKTRSEWQRDAQRAFNEYIRVRDRGKPCVSCGAYIGSSGHGSDCDAGHYRSRGSAPLEFHTHNVHAQCKKCNRHLGGNIVEYRKGLVRRIGVEKVEAIESDNRVRHYTITDYKRIIKLAKKAVRRERRFKQ